MMRLRFSMAPAWLPMLGLFFAAGVWTPTLGIAQDMTPEPSGQMPRPSQQIDILRMPEGLDLYLQPGTHGLFDRFDAQPGQWGLALHSEFTAASSALPYAMLQRLIWGGFIDAELKQQALDASGEGATAAERAGLEWLNGATLSFGLLPANTWADVTGYVRVGSSVQLGVGFHPDLYTLLFYGNAPLAGRDAQLANTVVQYQRTQALEFGMSIRKVLRGRNRLFAGLGAGLVQGIRYDEAELNGRFLTASDGSRLDLDLSGAYRSTDSSGRWDEAYGWGWTTTGQFRFERFFKEGLWGMVFAEVQDLGSVRWNGPATRYDADSSWTFEGLSIQDLEDLSSGVLLGDEGGAADSLLALLQVEGQDGGFNAALRPLVSAGVHVAVERWRFAAGYRQRLSSPMRPLLWTQAGYAFAKGAVEPRFTLAHGGWGSWQAGAELRLSRPRASSEGFRPELRLGTTDLLGLLAPMAANGGTAYVQLAARF
jgi:hypothetical protein